MHRSLHGIRAVWALYLEHVLLKPNNVHRDRAGGQGCSSLMPLTISTWQCVQRRLLGRLSALVHVVVLNKTTRWSSSKLARGVGRNQTGLSKGAPGGTCVSCGAGKFKDVEG